MLSRLKRNAREECWPNLILSSTVFSPFALFYLKIFNRETFRESINLLNDVEIQIY